MLHYEGNDYDENGNIKEKVPPFRLRTVCIPIRPGWSRMFVMPEGLAGMMMAKKRTEISVNHLWCPTFLSFFRRWLLHVFHSRFLHYQEREARARAPDRVANAYYMPAFADRCVAPEGLKTWKCISYWVLLASIAGLKLTPVATVTYR